MKYGAIFPQTEYPSDPAAIKDYAQTIEGLGFSHVQAYDHILGANPDRPGGWKGSYTYQDPFQEPFVLFGFMAGFTERLGFTTGIIILPQRQTALVAKQAATLDVLSGGRLRLGVGLGWNEVEYVALNEDFSTRGKRIEEQVQLLHRLWSEPLVTFEGRWHTIQDAGLNPLPVNRSIPILFGGRADPMLRRAAQLGDGWLPNFPSPDDALPALEKLNRFLEEAGRSRQDFQLEARLNYRDGYPDTVLAHLRRWEELGATHISINTMSSGLQGAQAHLDALRKFADAVGMKK